ncbi:MAG: helix-turn-helix domain-containing protein [Nitrososphaeria archaeon]|nr:helix-turn-helix domain-containing protein [Nitrososphaeria archaeon]
MLLTAIKDRSEEDLVWLLRYKTRRRILLAIGDMGKVSATALRDSLKISTGSLYYNLRQLRMFVTQDSDRNYILTEEGKRVYRALKEKGTISAADLMESEPPSKLSGVLSNIFFPVWLYNPLYEQKAAMVIVSALCFAISSALLIYTRQIPLLLHFYPIQPSPLLIIGYYVLNVVLIYVLFTVFTPILSGSIFKRGEGGKNLFQRIVFRITRASSYEELKFFLGLFVAILPLMIFPAILAVNKLFSLGIIPLEKTQLYYLIRDAFLIIAQIATLPLLIAFIAYGRRTTGTTAALTALVIFFISHIIYQLLTVGFVPGI